MDSRLELPVIALSKHLHFKENSNMETKSSEIGPTVHLFLTVAQANVVAEALELYARLGLGQIETITELFNES